MRTPNSNFSKEENDLNKSKGKASVNSVHTVSLGCKLNWFSHKWMWVMPVVFFCRVM